MGVGSGEHLGWVWAAVGTSTVAVVRVVGVVGRAAFSTLRYLDGAGRGERPARPALALVLDRRHRALRLPVDGGRGRVGLGGEGVVVVLLAVQVVVAAEAPDVRRLEVVPEEVRELIVPDGVGVGSGVGGGDPGVAEGCGVGGG